MTMKNSNSIESHLAAPGHHAPSPDSKRGTTSWLDVARSLVASVLASALLLSGCAVGPNYQRPKVNVPTDFRGAEAAAQQASFADLPWWDAFKDEELKSLIKTALANNYDLAVAVSRVDQAQQIAAQARAQYFPFVNYGVGASYGKNEFFGTIAPTTGLSTAKGAFVATASAAWEPDIWGRIRRLNESARAQYLSTEEARRGVMLSLTANVAQAYFQLLGLELLLDIAKQTTASFTDTYNLFMQRYEGGVASKLDTSRAEAAEAAAAANIPEYERQIAVQEDQLSVLLGQNPSSIKHRSKLLDQVVPPEIPVGLPSALLERRPDVLTAEQQMRSANAQIGVATANFFPQLGLTALVGQASTPLTEITSKGNVWSIAGNFAGPIYQGGLLRAEKRQAVAFWQQTKVQYEQAALNAFTDVANALISRQKYEAIRDQQARSVAAYQQAVQIALQRYQAGKASYFEVLDAQIQLYPEENALAQTEINRRVVVVQLYLALGGGWNLSDADWQNMSVTPGPSPASPKTTP